MKATLLTAVLVLLALAVPRPAMTQDHYTPGGPVASPPMYYDHASTWEEGVMRGAADVLRGAGEMHYNNSLAAINVQEAYSRFLDNRLQAASTYFDLRKLNREARAEERGQRASAEKLAEFANVRAPDRLAATSLDATTNRLIWPRGLEDPNFAEERATIDRLMTTRTSVGPESQDIQRLAESMTEKLRTQIHTMKPSDYLAAKRFLTSLNYEMNFVPGATTVAVR